MMIISPRLANLLRPRAGPRQGTANRLYRPENMGFAARDDGGG